MAPDTGCESIAFEVVDDEDRGCPGEVTTPIDSDASICQRMKPSSNFVVSAGENTTYKVKLDDHNGGSTGEFDVWQTTQVAGPLTA